MQAMMAPPAFGADSFPDPRRTRLYAGIFVSDLVTACESVLAVFGDRASAAVAGHLALDAVTLPITVPIDDHGVVVLSTGHVEAPRHPATLTVARPKAPPGRAGYRAAFLLARTEDRPLMLPGILPADAPSGPAVPAALGRLSVAVAPKGLAVMGFDRDGTTTPIRLDETTSRLLATALLITVGVKLTKAERGER